MLHCIAVPTLDDRVLWPKMCHAGKCGFRIVILERYDSRDFDRYSQSVFHSYSFPNGSFSK